jgi:hypothetical protein
MGPNLSSFLEAKSMLAFAQLFMEGSRGLSTLISLFISVFGLLLDEPTAMR